MAGRYKQLYEKSIIEMRELVDKINDITCNPHIEIGRTARAYGQLLIAKDRAQCANRYTWKNLPINLTSQELESFFYDFGSLCWFIDEQDKLNITKYATGGTLNRMGMLSKIKPIDFAGHSYATELNVLQPNGNVEDGKGNNVAVIINDYTGSYIIKDACSRALLNSSSTIADQTTVYQQLINNVIVSGKKALALAENEEQGAALRMQALNMLTSARPVEVLVGRDSTKGAPLEMFNFANNFDCGNYCAQLDYYDKVRANFNGIATPPTAEKREHLINAEVENASNVSDIMLYDGLKCRQDGLKLLKSYYPYLKEIQAIEVEISECLKPQSEPKIEEQEVEINE